ncbi:hypothetical protein SDC9_199055 [bioreactor metagenome]|uniref:Uncharacterized protein n=1 Tax=bioreactor metagenome TaxID=1076179 RepID=A0A645IJU7_9ZZZZ
MVIKGQGVQVIYGPTVPNIKSNLEEFLETPEADNLSLDVAEAEAPKAGETPEAAEKNGTVEFFSSPIDGRVASIEETPDDAFSRAPFKATTASKRLSIARISSIEGFPLSLSNGTNTL